MTKPAIKETIPIIIKTPIATDKNPVNAITINIIGNKITVNKILLIPHAALIANIIILSNTASNKTIKTNVNISITSSN